MFICGAYCFVFDVGSNRDGDELLEPLCEDWLQIKGQLTSKKALLFFLFGYVQATSLKC